MSAEGTAAYDGLTDLPPLVQRAVDLARRLGFANSCRPEHGRLLRALAAGAGTIGETGTGCGVGLAWLASGARPGTRLVSVEIDTERAGLVAGDIILALDGAAITGADDLVRMLTGDKIGRTIEVEVLHNGNRRLLSLVPQERVPRS